MRKTLKLIFLVWIALWIFFTARELFIKGRFSEYRVLSSRSLEGKRSYVTGDRLYELLVFSNQNLPMSSSYKIIGTEKGSIEERRSAYYLYPHLEREDADFILVFDSPGLKVDGYEPYKGLDKERYLLKRRDKNWK